MTGAPDGRAAFSFGYERVPRMAHVIWRHIATLAIFTPPLAPEGTRPAG